MPIIRGSALKALQGDPEAEKAITELMAKVDEYIPEPVRDVDKPFLMPVEDVFSIKGRGTVATGRVTRGKLALNEEIALIGIQPTTKTTVTGIEIVKKGKVIIILSLVRIYLLKYTNYWQCILCVALSRKCVFYEELDN